jgi:pimeloyl-ACP methyl ester carboxylesterase
MTAAWIAAAVVALASAGVLYQRAGTARHKREFAAPGELIDVGGHRLHVHCVGVSTPVVIFESGIAASSVSWTMVQPEVAAFARTCAYDRAGLAWSDTPSCPRSFARIVDEFAAVVSHSAGNSRCVLVGHSFGSFVVRAFATRTPQQIAGVVLVEPPTEWLQLTPERARLLRGGQLLSRIGAMLAHLGVVRASLRLLSSGAPTGPRLITKLFGPTAALTLERLVGEVRKLPPSVHPLVQAHWSQPKCFHAMAQYIGALARDGATIAAVALPREVPVTVISSGRQSEARLAEHRSLVETAERGKHVVAQNSGHWVQFDEPEVVVKAIRELIDVERSGER